MATSTWRSVSCGCLLEAAQSWKSFTHWMYLLLVVGWTVAMRSRPFCPAQGPKSTRLSCAFRLAARSLRSPGLGSFGRAPSPGSLRLRVLPEDDVGMQTDVPVCPAAGISLPWVRACEVTGLSPGMRSRPSRSILEQRIESGRPCATPSLPWSRGGYERAPLFAQLSRVRPGPLCLVPRGPSTVRKLNAFCAYQMLMSMSTTAPLAQG